MISYQLVIVSVGFGINYLSQPAYDTGDSCLARLSLAVGPIQWAICPLTIWCRLHYRWVFSLVVSQFWGWFNPALEGKWPMRLIPLHKMAAHFWFRTYNWFTYLPIAFREIIYGCDSSVTLGHVFYNYTHWT